MAEQYDELADVYDFFVPDALLEPAGNAATFADLVELPGGARVLDCAAGPGQLAVGLALRGCAVAASDASAAMVARTRSLADEHGVRVDARVCTWEELADVAGWQGAFDAVFCVGNSLAHAVGERGRRAALRAMAGALRAGGVLVVTSRNWELVRARGSLLQVGERLVERGGRRGLTVYAWSIPPRWEESHHVHTAVALVGEDGTVTTHGEHLQWWPFTEEQLAGDLRATGFEPNAASTGVVDKAERYVVTARRR